MERNGAIQDRMESGTAFDEVKSTLRFIDAKENDCSMVSSPSSKALRRRTKWKCTEHEKKRQQVGIQNGVERSEQDRMPDEKFETLEE